MNDRPKVSLTKSVRAAVIRNSLHLVLVHRLKRAGSVARTLMIASPWLSSADEESDTISSIASVIHRYKIRTYIFTRTPKTDAHKRAVDKLSECVSVEIVLNDNLHAKVYACIAPYPYGFALLGSANLTSASEYMHEIGLLVLSAGGGDAIVKELASFGLDYLRTRPDSLVLKRCSIGR
jgi:hypothetical protein